MISIKSNTNSSSNKDQSHSNKSDQVDSKKSATGGTEGKESTTDGKETDKYSRFENEGVIFKAKLIGSELVMDPRGDKMCQNSIQRLKAIIKGTNSHKKRIVLKISYDGVKVYDEKTNEILHHHEVSQISYIASDDTDNRTFGYVSDVPNKAHQFICFKTSGPAINVMSVISSLFEAVLEKKNQAKKQEQQAQQVASGDQIISTQQDSMDLIGDSGIMDNDASVTSEENNSSKFSAQFTNIMNQQQQQQNFQSQQQVSSSSILDNLNSIGSLGNSFSSSFNASSNNMSSTINNNININRTSNNNNNNNNNNNTNESDTNRLGKQSASTNLIFDDLFTGLSDPIIVDKNESFISYSRQQSQQQPQHQQLQSSQPPVSIGATSGGGGGFPGSGSMGGHLQALASGGSLINPSNSLGSANFFVVPPPPPPPRSNDGSQNQLNQLAPSQSIGRPIPRRQYSQQQSQAGGSSLPPSSLPRPTPMMNQSNQGRPQHNRSLVYNHSSVSLSDAALTRQTSFSSNNINDGHTDRYAVFNDIDNLPSIFESTSLGTGQQQQLHQQHRQQQPQMQHQQQHQMQQQTPSPTMFRQTNPFDDDFFA